MYLVTGASEDTAGKIIDVLLRFRRSALENAFRGVTTAIGLTAELPQGIYRKIIDRGDHETLALMYRLSMGLVKYGGVRNIESAVKILEYINYRAMKMGYGDEIKQQAAKLKKGSSFTSRIDDELSRLETKVRTQKLEVLVKSRLRKAGLSMDSAYASRLTMSHLAILEMVVKHKLDIDTVQDVMIRGGIDVDQLELTTFMSEDKAALDRIMASRDVKKIMDEAIYKTQGHTFTHVQGVTIPYIDVAKVTAFAMKSMSTLVERDSHFAEKASKLKANLAQKKQLMAQYHFRCVAAVDTGVVRQVEADVHNAVDDAVAKRTKAVAARATQISVAAELLDRAAKEVEKRTAKQASDQIAAHATHEVQKQIEARTQEDVRAKTEQQARDQAARATQAAADKATQDAVQARVRQKVEEERNVLAQLARAPSVPQSAPSTPASVREFSYCCRCCVLLMCPAPHRQSAGESLNPLCSNNHDKADNSVNPRSPRCLRFEPAL